MGAGGLAAAEAEAGSEGIRNLDATMRIQPGKVVTMDYTLRLENGEEIESAIGKSPFAFSYGEGTIIPGLEKGSRIRGVKYR